MPPVTPKRPNSLTARYVQTEMQATRWYRLSRINRVKTVLGNPAPWLLNQTRVSPCTATIIDTISVLKLHCSVLPCYMVLGYALGRTKLRQRASSDGVLGSGLCNAIRLQCPQRGCKRGGPAGMLAMPCSVRTWQQCLRSSLCI